MRRALLFVVAFSLLVGVGAFTARFDYLTVEGQALRVNRFSGSTEVLRPGQGWRPIRTTATTARYLPPAVIPATAGDPKPCSLAEGQSATQGAGTSLRERYCRASYRAYLASKR